MIRGRWYMGFIGLLLAAHGASAWWAARETAASRAERAAAAHLAGVLQLTDLALWSEARYTRHPAMADLFSPFQDHPGALEHFPAGALLAPAAPRPESRLEVRRRGAGE